MRVLAAVTLALATGCSSGGHSQDAVATPAAVSTSVVTVTPPQVATQSAQPSAKVPRGQGHLLGSGDYRFTYWLETEISCSQSYEEDGAHGDLVMEVRGSEVTLRIDDSLTHLFGSQPRQYVGGSSNPQATSTPRHLSFHGAQTVAGDHVKIDLDGGLAIECAPSDVELGADLDPDHPDTLVRGKVLKGFRCSDASKLFDLKLDEIARMVLSVPFVSGAHLSLSNHSVSGTTIVNRLGLATP